MHFHTEHLLHGSPEVVGGVISDPQFYAQLQLPDLSLPQIIEHSADGDGVLIRLRYEFTGSLDPIAQRLLGNERLAWTQDVRYDRTTRSGSLEFGAEKDPRRLHGSASFTLAPEPGEGGTLRSIDGELVVAVPAIGHMAERRIVPGIVRRMDIEAEGVNRRIAEAGSG